MGRKITVTPYNPKWADDFLNLKNLYQQQLSHLVKDIHHVGSTSVEGLAAKPRIDIDIEIDRKDFNAVRSGLEELGYQYQGDLGIADREAFKYLHDDRPAHNLYVCPSDSRELQRHLAFRNYLRSNVAARTKYCDIKLEAIKLGKETIEEYMDHKGSVVVEILEAALKTANLVPGQIKPCGNCSSLYNLDFRIDYLGNGDKREVLSYICPNCGHHEEEID